MRSMILMGCLFLLAVAGYSQPTAARVKSGNPLRWSMNGSVEIMEGDLTQYYGSTDSNIIYKRISTYESATLGIPHVTRVASVQALCEQNSVQLNWVAAQHFNADSYEVEQSSDGRNWISVGIIPANVTEFGAANYSFNYTKNASNVLFRINAVSTTGEHVYSSIIESPCSSNSYLAITPNPVYSTTTIRLGSPVATKVKLMLVNSSGVVVQTSNAGLSAGINQLPLDMSSLPRGYYSLFIQWMGGRQDVTKLIKQ